MKTKCEEDVPKMINQYEKKNGIKFYINRIKRQVKKVGGFIRSNLTQMGRWDAMGR